MSDAAPPDRAGPVAEGGRRSGPLTPDRIDAVLADFRGWLEELAEDRGDEPPGSPEPVDLYTLVAQFTALRHEVNLQTKAVRAAVEQTAEAIRLATQPRPTADPDEATRPLVKALIDIADALAVSHRQVEKARAAAEGLLTPPPARARPGFLARLFGGATEVATPAGEPQTGALRALLAGVADGYAMSVRRVERVLPQFGLEPVECVGRPFDPDRMEVVEVVAAEGRTSGTVVEEVRRGYRWNGKPFRFAQVKVAR